ncbi:MAG TPA: thioredoxin fold domain-containing protein [Gemmatimonadaceae bacterium]
MEAEVWPLERVERFVESNFIPVRVHVRDQADAFQRLGERYSAQWTPTTLVLSPDGTERHRVEGFLPADDLLAQFELGLAQVAFARGDWEAAERHFTAVAEGQPEGDAAPEATYWAGVSRYKASNDGAALADTAKRLAARYPGSTWAKKSSVWQ